MRLWPWIRQPDPKQEKRDLVQDNQDYEQYTAYSQLLDRNGQWIGVADTKAGVILGFLVIIFPLLAPSAFMVVQKGINAILKHADFRAYLPTIGFIILLLLFLAGAFITLLCVLMTLTPRLVHQGKSGLLFFSDIANQEYEQWQQQIYALDPQQLAHQVLEQVYATACIAHYKHIYVRQAIRALLTTILIGLVLSILSQYAS